MTVGFRATQPFFTPVRTRSGTPFRARQRGFSTLKTLSALVVLAGLGGGAWWWSQGGDWASVPGVASLPKWAGGSDNPAAGASAPAGGASGAGQGGQGGPGGRRFGGANRVQPVTVAPVQTRDIKVALNAIGNMAALNTAIVRARVDGELKAIRFKEGQLVRAGDVLAEIDPRTYEAQLAQAQGQLSRDQAQLRNAQLDLERYQDLLTKDSIAKQQVDTQDALVKQLLGTVQTDQAQVDNAKLLLSYTQVIAPISGKLGLKTADLGSIVRAGDAAGLVTITQTQPIALVFAVPEANLLQITRKLKGKEPLLVEVWDRDQRNRLGNGRVITTDNAIDAATGTIKLKAEFPNADGSLFPNQFVNVKVQVDTLAGVTAVPTNAVQRGVMGTFVYVVKDDNTVNTRRVRLGTTEGDWVSVQGELEAGERVVTDGADRLREGAKVEVITPPPRFGGGGGGMGGGIGGGVGPGGGARPPAVAGSGPVTPGAPGAPATGGAPDAGAGKPPGERGRGPNEGPVGGMPRGPEGGPPRGPDGGARPPNGPPPGERPPGERPAGGPPGGPPPGAGAGGPGGLPPRADGLPPWFDRLPPEMQERFKKMNPDERKEFIEKMRERRRQREAEGG